MTAETELCVSIGDVVAGKYRVDGVIGVGGMAFVVAASHLELEQRFALKFLSARFAAQPEFVERFTREAKAACRLRSEHIARVHDVGIHRGTPFLVMEHLVGSDLANVLAEGGPLPTEEAVEYAIQACEALATAHNSGVVHRDVKPENLFRVDEDGIPHVKLLDFGISKIEGPLPRQTGELSMGTPTYMAPEQVRSTASADARSDQWSLGVVLYELLAGAPPFMAPSVGELCAAVLEQTPARLDEIHPEIPAPLAEVVARCLEKNPDARHRDVAALAEALLPWAPTRAVAAAERAARVLSGVASGNPLSRSTPPVVAVSASVASRTGPPAPRRPMPRGLLVLAGAAAIAAAAVAISARSTTVAAPRPALAAVSDPPAAIVVDVAAAETSVAVDPFRVAKAGGAPKPAVVLARHPVATARSASPMANVSSVATSAAPSIAPTATVSAATKIELGY
jgi:eukaryotic-like serine/threonine-protein kinase